MTDCTKMAESTATSPPTEENATNQIPENSASLEEKLQKSEKLLKTSGEKAAQLETTLKKKDEELTSARARVSQLEEELSEAQKFKAQHAKDAEEVNELKIKSEDTLTRAKSIIFDKTKVIKNQELQLDALNQQIVSLKDVVSITKDLLEIRNLEIKQLENKITAMEGRVGAEKERHELMHKKLEHMIRYNGELKREYETQLCLFSALRERYSERELAKGVVAQEQAAAARQPANGAASSSEAPAAAAVEAEPEPKEAASSNEQVSAGVETEEACLGNAEVAENGGAPGEATPTPAPEPKPEPAPNSCEQNK